MLCATGSNPVECTVHDYKVTSWMLLNFLQNKYKRRLYANLILFTPLLTVVFTTWVKFPYMNTNLQV